ncbi:MAG: hypothetical protein AABW79_04355 [Nanoarchaeota archaeon]
MPQKKKDKIKKLEKKELSKSDLEEENEEKEDNNSPLIKLSTLIIFASYAILISIFILLLNRSLGLPFNIIAFIVGIFITIVITGFLLVVKSVMRTNLWEGLVVGLATIGVVVTALLFKFHGTYTNIFATFGTILALIYIGYFFKKDFKQKNNFSKESEASQELSE